MDIWYNCLTLYCEHQKDHFQMIEPKKFKLIDFKQMKKASKKSPEDSETAQVEEVAAEAPPGEVEEAVARLASCFKYIYENTGRLQENVAQMDSFESFCLKVITTIPQLSKSTLALVSSDLAFHLLACYSLCLVKKGGDQKDQRLARKKIGRNLVEQMTQSTSKLRQQVSDCLFDRLNSLQKIKSMPNMDRRTHALHQAVAASVLTDMLDIGSELVDGNLENQRKLNVFVQNLVGLV